MTGEELRNLAFDAVYLLPGTERPDTAYQEPQELLSRVTTEERDRALRMAARRLAFQLLYQLDAMASPPAAGTFDQVIAAILAGVEGLGPMALEDVSSLVRGAFDNRQAADDEFRDLAPEWPTHRQAAVDRAILRLAHYEMTSGRTPSRIVVNEAVELAKHFSTEKSPAFINGLLDKTLKRLEAQPGPAFPSPT